MKAQTEIPMKGLEIWACEWEDAHYDSNEYSKDEIAHRPLNYVSVGILLMDDDKGFTTATDISETGLYRGINFVPAKMILRKWRVGQLAPRKKQSKQPLISADMNEPQP